MQILNEVKLDYDDVLLVPKRSFIESRQEIELVREFKYIPYRGIPILVANMDHCGTFSMARALLPYRVSVSLHKFYKEKELVEFWNSRDSEYAWYTLGTNKEDVEKFKSFYFKSFPRYVCIDIANGYSNLLRDTVARIREFVDSTCIIMAGNVVTPDMTYDLLREGANVVKIGIGPGAACITREVTGVGYPQLSAVMECADAAHGVNGHICADGGIKTSGDFAKAFGAGADFVMGGSIFSGYSECNGNFRGMASREAMIDHYGEKASYRASEGKEIPVEPKGPVREVCEEILGGLRSACSYVGASSLKDLPKCATFVQVNRIK